MSGTALRTPGNKVFWVLSVMISAFPGNNESGYHSCAALSLWLINQVASWLSALHAVNCLFMNILKSLILRFHGKNLVIDVVYIVEWSSFGWTSELWLVVEMRCKRCILVIHQKGMSPCSRPVRVFHVSHELRLIFLTYIEFNHTEFINSLWACVALSRVIESFSMGRESFKREHSWVTLYFTLIFGVWWLRFAGSTPLKYGR